MVEATYNNFFSAPKQQTKYSDSKSRKGGQDHNSAVSEEERVITHYFEKTNTVPSILPLLKKYDVPLDKLNRLRFELFRESLNMPQPAHRGVYIGSALFKSLLKRFGIAVNS